MSDTVAVPTPMAPAEASERLEVIDALRGLALAGILAANMRGFAFPAAAYFDTSHIWPSGADFWIQFAVDTLIQGKFITIFAFLFGLGFASQFDRAEARGASFKAVYARRLTILIFFGLLHQLLLWWGDILVTYGVIGFLLLLFRRSSNTKLFRWAIACYWIPIAFMLAGAIAIASGVNIGGPPPTTKETIDAAVRTYREGALPEIFRLRLKELAQGYMFLPIFGWRVLSLFLFGALAWRSRIFHDPAAIAPRIRRWLVPLFVAGIIGNAIPVAGFSLYGIDPMKPTFATWVLSVIQSIGIPALSAFYVGLVVLAYSSTRLPAFAAVGRMALTNYLTQSLVCTTIFYSYGLAQFGKHGAMTLLVLAALVYALQIAFSAWWLRSHRFGPTEVLWRALTYGHK